MFLGCTYIILIIHILFIHFKKTTGKYQTILKIIDTLLFKIETVVTDILH